MQTLIHEPVCADAELFLREFLRQSATLRPMQRPDWLARCKNWQSRYPVVLPEYRDENAGYVNPYFLVDVLAGELNEDDLLTPGSSGPCSDIFMQASILDMYDPDRAQINTYLGEIRSWSDYNLAIKGSLNTQKALKGAGLRILSAPTGSPTMASLMDQVKEGMLTGNLAADAARRVGGNGAADGSRASS